MPTANITVEMVTKSLIGVAVGGATMKLEWRIVGKYSLMFMIIVNVEDMTFHVSVLTL